MAEYVRGPGHDPQREGPEASSVNLRGQRPVRLRPPPPVPLAPRAAPTLGEYAPARSLQRLAVQPVFGASLAVRRLLAEQQSERASLQRQIERLRADLLPGAEEAALQRQQAAAWPPTRPLAFQR